IIRGLDGDRIRVLQGSVGTLDASGLSYDHAVPVDPLAVTRIEVVRGAAALMYGGSAVGGVVNVLTNRVPDAPREGVEGAIEMRAGGAE
ncbi:TonB-dependent receptor plug domain-containing protein, partial [Acinetobacter baumannii]